MNGFSHFIINYFAIVIITYFSNEVIHSIEDRMNLQELKDYRYENYKGNVKKVNEKTPRSFCIFNRINGVLTSKLDGSTSVLLSFNYLVVKSKYGWGILGSNQ